MPKIVQIVDQSQLVQQATETARGYRTRSRLNQTLHTEPWKWMEHMDVYKKIQVIEILEGNVNPVFVLKTLRDYLGPTKSRSEFKYNVYSDATSMTPVITHRGDICQMLDTWMQSPECMLDHILKHNCFSTYPHDKKQSLTDILLSNCTNAAEWWLCKNESGSRFQLSKFVKENLEPYIIVLCFNKMTAENQSKVEFRKLWEMVVQES